MLLRLPDDLDAPRDRCLETVSVAPIGAPAAGAHRDWWFDLGSDVGSFLAVAVATTQAANPTFAARLQSTTIQARTSETGRFTAAWVLERRWAPQHHGCASRD